MVNPRRALHKFTSSKIYRRTQESQECRGTTSICPSQSLHSKPSKLGCSPFVRFFKSVSVKQPLKSEDISKGFCCALWFDALNSFRLALQTTAV